MYVSNNQNYEFDDLLFNGDERLINIQLIYCINDDILEMFENGYIIERLNNVLVVDIYTNRM